MAREKLTPSELIKLAAERVLEAGIRGLSRGTAPSLDRAAEGGSKYLDHLSVEWERAWAVSAGLLISIYPKAGASVTVSWSSTQRTPGAARAALALYAEEAEAAADVYGTEG